MRLLTWLSSAAVIAAIVTTIVMRPPAQQREHRFDAQRLGDLFSLRGAIDISFEENGSLPVDLNAVVARSKMQLAIHDPVTGATYPYHVLSVARYQLCAVFALASERARPPTSYAGAAEWLHPAGSHCFEFQGVTRGAASPG